MRQFEFGESLCAKQDENDREEGFHIEDLFKPKLAELDGEIVNLFSVDIDDGVFDSWIFDGEIEVDSSERLLFVVAEEGMVDEFMNVLIGEP